MNGRKLLVDFAAGVASDEDIKTIQRLILNSEAVATGTDGHDESTAFASALVKRFGLKRPTGRPINTLITAREIAAYLRIYPRALSQTALAKKISEAFCVSTSTAHSRIKDAYGVISDCRVSISVRLQSEEGKTGQKLLDEALLCRDTRKG